jgi:hypothetical protein
MSRIKGLKAQAGDLNQHASSAAIKQPETRSVGIEIEGTAPLIQNCFSQKSIEQMLRKHMGMTVEREVKKPREVIEAATIRNVKGVVCMPPTAFKKAMLTAAGSIKTLKKTQLRTQLFVEGNAIPITFEGAMVPRMDMVRTSGMARTPDVRFRPSFEGWKARLLIEFGDMLSVQTVVDLLNRAGSVGVGEWRPEKDGTNGTFRTIRILNDAKEVAEVRDICTPQLVRPTIPEWALDMDIDPEILKRVFDGERASGTDG